MTLFRDLRRTINSIVNLREHIDVDAAADNIRSNVYFRGPNVYILFFAILIASLGLNVNSIPVIIGAMLVSPLMGPIVGLGLALGTNDSELLRDSVRHLLIMVGISIVASTLYFILTPLRLENPSELLARTNPTIYDVLIAFFGGAAGIMETSRRDKGTVIAGVAIATALMPPLCTIGFGISQLNLSYAMGALYLFFINSVFIALASFLGVKYLRFTPKKYHDATKQKRIHRVIVLVLIVITIPSILTAVSVVRQNNFERSADKLVTNLQKTNITYVYDHRIDHTQRPPQIELFLAGRQLDASDRETIYALAEEQSIQRSQLIINTSAIGNDLSPYSEEFITNALSRQTEMQRQKDSIIASLQQQLADYQRRELPSQQLSEEIRTQYPQVTEIVIASGSQLAKDNKEKEATVVIVHAKSALSEAEHKKLQSWLEIRLKRENVIVVVQ